MPTIPRQMRLTRAHVALLPQHIDDPGPMPHEDGGPPSDDFYRTMTANLLAGAPAGGEVWLFACGSLIWNQRFDHIEERVAVARGWHRDFCLGPDTRFRGNPAAPGYMLALDRGGQCRGMVYRFPPDTLAANVERLLRTEPPWPPVWLNAMTDQGMVRAFAFTHPGQKSPIYAGRVSDEAVADALASAVGMRGNMADYLQATVEHLERLGLCDTRLWRMQEMVAERIERNFPGQIQQAP